MAPRIFTLVYGFINICKYERHLFHFILLNGVFTPPLSFFSHCSGKEPWQAGQAKHMEAYEAGMTTGDMEYALTNLYQYANTAIYGGENVAMLSQNIPLYAKRAYQVNQLNSWKSLCILVCFPSTLVNAFCQIHDISYLTFSTHSTNSHTT